MIYQEDGFVSLLQIISGILLFKDNFTDLELINIISKVYEKLNLDVIDDEFVTSDIYKLLETEEKGYRLGCEYNYDSIIIVNKKKMLLYDYLKINTTFEIVQFLMNNFYFEVEYQNKNICNELNSHNFMVGNVGKVKQKKHGFI